MSEDLTNLEARYLMDGLTFFESGLDEFTHEYFRIAPALWDRLTNEMAQRTLEGMYPRWSVDQASVDQAQTLIDDASLPAGLRRVLAEGQDRTARALRNRAVDRAAG